MREVTIGNYIKNIITFAGRDSKKVFKKIF